MRAAAPAVVLVLFALLPGCLERELVVKPEPADSLVFVDGLEIRPDKKTGFPTLNFEHYGIRRVVVRRQGFTAQEQLVTLDPPWYQITPLDFVTDVLVPFTITDRREVTVKLEPRTDLQDRDAADKVLERAKGLSSEARSAAEKP